MKSSCRNVEEYCVDGCLYCNKQINLLQLQNIVLYNRSETEIARLEDNIAPFASLVSTIALNQGENVEKNYCKASTFLSVRSLKGAFEIAISAGKTRSISFLIGVLGSGTDFFLEEG